MVLSLQTFVEKNLSKVKEEEEKMTEPAVARALVSEFGAEGAIHVLDGWPFHLENAIKFIGFSGKCIIFGKMIFEWQFQNLHFFRGLQPSN